MTVFPHLPASSAQQGPASPARVCIASYELLGPCRNGGIGTGYSALANALAEAGHHVTLLYLFGQWCENGTLADWHAYYRDRGIQFCVLPPTPHLAEGSQSIRISIGAYEWLRDREFDFIHFPELLGHAYYSVLAKHQGLAFNDTVICVGVHSPISWIREVNRELPMSTDEPQIDFMERESVALADVIVSPSQYLLGWMLANGWRLPSATYVQQYVLSPELWSAWKDRTKTDVLHTVTALTFFGRLEERKGLALFCDALDLLITLETPPFTVSFLGKSALVAGRDAIAYIQERAGHWPFAWQIISDRDQRGALDLLSRDGRLAVIPSLVDNLPNAVLECLCAGIPFVTSHSGGIPEAIDAADVDRVTFPVDPLALAERLRSALREGVTVARPAIDPEDNRYRWVAWHNRSRLLEARDKQTVKLGMKDTLVSVCLVQPPRPELLRQSLAALQAQSWRNLEIIMAVPGSGSAGEVELEPTDAAAAKRELRLITLRTGSSNEWDVAAACARGDYILFIDSRTISKPEQITTLVEAAERSGADVLTSFLDLYAGNARPEDGIFLGRRPFLGAAVIPGIFYNCYGQGGIFVRREALLRVGGFATTDWKPCEDWEFLAKIVVSGLRLEVVPKPLAWYRVDIGGSNRANENGNGIAHLRPFLLPTPPVFRDLLKLSLFMKQQNDRAYSGNHNHVSTLSEAELMQIATLSEAELMEIVQARLAMGGNRRIASFLKSWADYNAARASLPKQRLKRVPCVVRQLFRGNYHRFAHGLGSALRDLRRVAEPRESSLGS